MPSLRELLRQVDEELAEANAKIDSLRIRLERERDEAKVVTVGLREELGEAKAEIERLQGLLDNATTVVDSWMARCHDLENLPDAEIGRLVQGMGQHTSLHCIAQGFYHARRHLLAGYTTVRTSVSAVEALRAIQKEGTRC